MKNISIVTMFKDSQQWHNRTINQVDRFFEQLSKMDLGQNKIYKIYALYGHSKDDTLNKIQSYSKLWPLEIIYEPDDNHIEVRSDTSTERLSRLSFLGDYLLSKIDYSKCDIVWWLESDLIIYDFNIANNLINLIKEDTAISTCQILLEKNGVFYDTLAFKSKDGQKINSKSQGIVLLKSCGSSLLIRSDVLKNHKMNGNCLMGLCKSIYDSGYDIVMDSSAKIYHPSNQWIKGKWI